MVIKLKSVFRDQRSVSVLKALVFVVLFWIQRAHPAILSMALFIIGVGILYLYPSFQNEKNLSSITILVVATLFISGKLSIPLPLIVTALISAATFYVVLNIKNVRIIQRERWQSILAIALTYGIILSFYLSDTSHFVSAKLALAFTGIFLVYREFFYNHFTESGFSRAEKVIYAGSIAFIGSQLLWIVGILPLNTLNAANCALLITASASSLVEEKLRGQLKIQTILLYLTVVITLLFVIFGVTKWSL